MSEKYAIPDHIRIVKAVCVEFGNNDNTWVWCYLDVKEALAKAFLEIYQEPCLLRARGRDDRVLARAV